MNDARCRVLAADVPSGLDAETGRPLPEAIRATLTLTIGAPKRGLLVPSAASFVGRLEKRLGRTLARQKPGPKPRKTRAKR